MTKLTKRMRNIHEKINKTKYHDISKAITLLKELATAKFIESKGFFKNTKVIEFT